MENIDYLGLPNCLRLSNDTVELIVTTDVGPRIVRYGFVGGLNILGEVPDMTINGEFKPWGGHRLWAAPEAKPQTYFCDDRPVSYETDGFYEVRLTAPVEETTQLQKEIEVRLAEEGTGVVVRHRISNFGPWEIRFAPWALTIMSRGGTAILPQEPFHCWSEKLSPARTLTLWHYTNLSDARYSIGQKYVRVRTDERLPQPQKIGIANKQGWAAYHRGHDLFIKSVGFQEGETYPDYGSNTEVYTAGSFIELETLGPLRRCPPGAALEHIEYWYLNDGVEIGGTEGTVEAAIEPILRKTVAPGSAGILPASALPKSVEE